MAEPPRIPRTVAEALDHVLAFDPDRRAVAGPSGALSYRHLDAAADAAAAVFHETGVRPGDRIAVALPNDLDIVVAFHAAMRLGAVWVGVNRALAAPEKQALLAITRPVLVLADPACAEELAPWSLLCVDPADRDNPWHAGLRTLAGAARPAAPDPLAPAAIAFTSGTTGLPLGVVHSQHNLLLPAASLVASRGYDAGLRKGDCLPLTILNLIVLTTLVASAAGGCCVLTDRRDARGVAEWIGSERLTVWNGVPAQLHGMVHDDAVDARWFATLDEVWTGGAGCPDDLLSAFRERFGVPVCATYGLTEAPTVVAIDPVGRHVAGASGRPLPHLELRVLDEQGDLLPPGVAGEIAVRAVADGPWAGAYRPMVGTWGPQGLEPYLQDELRTGDLGSVDEDGWLTIRDRKKLLILRGGANVSPAEVERVLAQAPGVREAVVLGIPDERLGQRVVAVVVPVAEGATGEASLLEHCRARLARYKVPERIALVAELPHNAMGKVQRAMLGELFTRPDGTGVPG